MNSVLQLESSCTACSWWHVPPLLLALSIGCQRGGPARIPLQGHVAYKGESVADGSISFVPFDKKAGAPISSVIQDGKYSIAAKDGPTLGSYRVEIEGFHKTGKQIPDMITPLPPGQARGTIEEKQPYIPSKYNHDSTLRAEIKAESKELNFDLKP